VREPFKAAGRSVFNARRTEHLKRDRLPSASALAGARERIDECQNCADKAAALYASQARDDTLFNFATRIKARALAIRKPRFWFTVTSQQKANNRKEWT
jgi:hypothetical protein